MSSANIVAEIHQKLCHERTLSTGEPCTCEYVTLLQSFHRCTLSLSIHCVLFRRSFKTVMFSRFLKATLNFMKKVYNGGFAREFSVSMLTIVLVRNYVSETRKNNQNQPKNICENKISKLFYWKVSSGFMRQGLQSSYSFAKIQNVGKPKLSNEKIQCFIGERFHISFPYTNASKAIVILFCRDYHCHNTLKYFRLTQ